jgi:predicted nuclease with TOPRIM domain
MRNENSNVNQKIKGKFVEREVYANVGTMVEYILNKSCEDREAPFTWDDVINMYADNSEEIEDKQEQIDELNNKIMEVNEDDENFETIIDNLQEQIDDLQNKIDELENEQEEPREVYQWFLVSDWLCQKLKEHGEVVIEDENIWGRGCCGQAILLDGVISNICEEMEILEGQKYEWK